MKIKRAKNKLSLTGDLVFEYADQGKDLLLNELDRIDASKAVTIDLTSVQEIDSSGFQLLLSFIKTLENRDIGFKLKKVHRDVFDLVNLAGLNKYLKIQAADVIDN